MPSPVVLAIVGGLGLSPVIEGNAVRQARMSWFLHAMETYPTVALSASGRAVGLSERSGGTPEAGYRTIGLGRPWHASDTRVDEAIRAGGMSASAAMRRLASHIAKTGGVLHMIGLVSASDSYAHVSHIHALLDFALEKHLPCMVHAILDSDPRSERVLREVNHRLVSERIGKIATVSGMSYAMDDDGYWDRTAKTYEAIVHGNGRIWNSIEELCDLVQEQTAEAADLEPGIFSESRGGKISEKDAVLFWNIRPLGMRQLLLAFSLPTFHSFDRGPAVRSMITSMVPYDRDLPVDAAFPLERTDISLASVIADAGLRQLRIAETERYAHTTVLFNGMNEQPFSGERRVIFSSPSVSSYDLAPEMCMHDISERVVQEIAAASQDVIICSLSAPDIVSRTGNMEATILACEAADRALARISEATLAVGGTVFVVSDHGRAESMMDAVSDRGQGEGTDHPVPFIIVRHAFEGLKAPSGDVAAEHTTSMHPTGTLADVAPTIIRVLGLRVPKEMKGRALV